MSSKSKLRCSVCRAEFSRPDALKRHEKIHSKAKLLECPFRDLAKCKRTFYRVDDLKVWGRHLISHSRWRITSLNSDPHDQAHLDYHNDPKFKPPAYSCDQCSRVFVNLAQFEKHKFEHSNAKHKQRPENATICSSVLHCFKNCLQNVFYRVYKSFCTWCNKGFKNDHGLRIHSCPKKKARSSKISAARKKAKKLKKSTRDSDSENDDKIE